LYPCVPSRALPIQFFRLFCCGMYHLSTKQLAKKLSGIKSRLQFENVNMLILMLTTAIPENGLKLYRTSYATADLVNFLTSITSLSSRSQLLVE